MIRFVNDSGAAHIVAELPLGRVPVIVALGRCPDASKKLAGFAVAEGEGLCVIALSCRSCHVERAGEIREASRWVIVEHASLYIGARLREIDEGEV